MYLIAKQQYDSEIYINCDRLKGYKVVPKNNFSYPGIVVSTMMIVKPDLIEKIIKRKIKMRLDYYLKFIIDGIEGTDSDDSRKALGDLQRYRIFVKERYTPFLDEIYLNLLDKKFDVLERELKNIYMYATLDSSMIFEEKEIESKRTR